MSTKFFSRPPSNLGAKSPPMAPLKYLTAKGFRSPKSLLTPALEYEILNCQRDSFGWFYVCAWTRHWRLSKQNDALQKESDTNHLPSERLTLKTSGLVKPKVF